MYGGVLIKFGDSAAVLNSTTMRNAKKPMCLMILSIISVVGSVFNKAGRLFLLCLVYFYRIVLRPHLGPACRYTPSCSEYAVQALRSLPLRKALPLVVKRIGNCRPGGGCGYDPVPGLGDYGK